jgi:transcriptional regulator with XRE-family HTH domain
MSQKDLAKGICISNSYLADVENDYRKANDRVVKLISITYGVSERWLKDGEGEMFYKAPDEKMTRLVSIFNELPPDFQDYALEQLEGLLKLRKGVIHLP